MEIANMGGGFFHLSTGGRFYGTARVSGKTILVRPAFGGWRGQDFFAASMAHAADLVVSLCEVC